MARTIDDTANRLFSRSPRRLDVFEQRNLEFMSIPHMGRPSLHSTTPHRVCGLAMTLEAQSRVS